MVMLPGTNTTKYGINPVNFRGAMLCDIIPKNIKLSTSLPEFKRMLRKHLIACNCVACCF